MELQAAPRAGALPEAVGYFGSAQGWSGKLQEMLAVSTGQTEGDFLLLGALLPFWSFVL